MENKIDYLEKEYGIKENEKYYSILFKLEEVKDTINIKGKILNFCPSQVVIKTQKGLYIIKPRNIIEMRPIKTKDKTIEKQTETVNIRGMECEIDNKCIPLVEFFNDIHLDTKFSCEGHKEWENFEIVFEDYVTDEQILDFVQKYSNKHNHTPFCGRFVKWCRKINDEIKYNWIYIVSKKEWAENDYRTMVNKWLKL